MSSRTRPSSPLKQKTRTSSFYTPTTSADEPLGRPDAVPSPRVVTAYDRAPNHFDVAQTLPWWRTPRSMDGGPHADVLVAVGLRLGLFEGG